MKKLEVEFQMNADNTGLQTFKQIKRTDKVAMYHRIRKDGTTHGYEVFEVKVVKAGTVYAKGAPPTKEDAESYTGAQKKNWHNAYYCKTLEQAEKRYDELVVAIKNRSTKTVDVAIDDDDVPEETVKSSGGKRGRKAKEIKMPIPKKGERFTMKRLMMWSGESQPNLYNRLKVMIEMGLVAIAGEVREAHTRGKAQVLYVSNTDDYASNIEVDKLAVGEVD